MPKKQRTRASNGMGSVRQRPDGRWEARYTTPNNSQKSVYGKTEKEVTSKLRSMLHDIDIGNWREPSRMTVSDWFDIWLKDYQGHTTERTAFAYQCVCDKHFKPILGNVFIAKLMPYHVHRMVTKMRESLSLTTIETYMAIFNAAMTAAVATHIIQTNPAENVKLPSAQPKKFCIIDRADFQPFVQAAMQTQYPYELIFMLYTGLRAGELRGLQWSDVDLDAGTLNIQRQLHPVSGDRPRFTSPKYNEIRFLHITPEAVDVLRCQQRRQAEQHIANADKWINTDISHDLVFRLATGAEHNEKTIYRAVKEAGAAIGKPDLHPHDLRHSYAIAALRSGMDVKTVQYNLGHKTASMTLNVYAAYTEDAGIEGAAKLSEYLKKTIKDGV